MIAPEAQLGLDTEVELHENEIYILLSSYHLTMLSSSYLIPSYFL